MTEKRSDVAVRDERVLERREHIPQRNPLALFERWANEFGSVFDEVGLGSWFAPQFRHGWLTSQRRKPKWDVWVPDVEVFQRNHDLVLRADLPGLRKEDITIEIWNDAITIQGERRQETEEERGGIYRSERQYGSFSRTIALPEGAMTDHSKATFEDGVLEITMPAPPEVMRGRKLEISESRPTKK
jgi:HSP20 family protein